MKRVRFLIDLYDLIDEKFYSYNDIAEFSDKRAKELYDMGCVDILKEEVKKETLKKETKPKKETKKKATKKDKEEKVDKK